MDLARMVTVSDPGYGTLDTLQEAADLLCRAYPTASAGELKARSKQRPSCIARPLSGRARHGDLDEAVHHGLTPFSYDRKTEASLLSHAADLDQLLAWFRRR